MTDDVLPAKPVTPEEQAAKIRVFIVDDSRLSRMSLKTTLATAPGQMEVVGEADDGQQALDMVGRLKPQIVLMDIGMPIMDGIRATQLIKAAHPDTQVIMLTSHNREQDVLDAFQSGAQSYCLKDTSPAMLIHVVLSTAHGACWIDPQIARIVMKQFHPGGNGSPMGARANAANDGKGNGDAAGDLLQPLTDRERDVLKLITDGHNNAEIADKLSISLNTVKTHLKNIFQKLGVEDRTAAALKALRERII